MKNGPGEAIRQFILAKLEGPRDDIAKLAAEEFGVTRQAVHRHLNSLLKAGLIVPLVATDAGLRPPGPAERTRRKWYALKVDTFQEELSLEANRDEDRVWRAFIEPRLNGLPDNVLRICHYGFTEMFNNAVEHSEGSSARVSIERSARSVAFHVSDNGVGIFEKIRSRFGLEGPGDAILELAKGKLTTDPRHHTGEGIFFTSRIFDKFRMSSGTVNFFHDLSGNDWLFSTTHDDKSLWGTGTAVFLRIAVDSPRTIREVFNRFADPEIDDYAFSRTHVPLKLAQYGQDQLMSRSQARRVLARFERFREVSLDFSGVEFIGQAFADEIFRVFATAHPEVNLVAVNTNEDVRRMIGRARAGAH